MRQVQIFVEFENLLDTLVSSDAVGFIRQECSKLDLQVGQERLCLLHEEIELDYAVRELLALGDFIAVFVDFCRFLDAFVRLGDRKLGQLLKPLFDLLPVRAREGLELHGVNNKIKL